MKIKILLTHLLFFALTLGALLLVCFYQVFVNQTGGRIPLRNFFTSSNLVSAEHSIFASAPTPNSSAIFFLSNNSLHSPTQDFGALTNDQSQSAQVFILPNARYFTAIQNNLLTIWSLRTNKASTVTLPKGSSYQVQLWLDEDDILLTAVAPNTSWSIVKLNLTSKELTPVVKNFSYPGKKLQLTTNPTAHIIAYPDCNPLCEINIFDTVSQKVLQKIPAFTGADKAPSISDMQLDFFDPDTGFIGYQSFSQQELYVIDRNLELWQSIRLENERNTAEYTGYIPETHQLAFRLREKNNSGQFVALYTADKPSLHLFSKTPHTETVVVLPAAKLVSIGQNLYNLNGKLIQQVSPEETEKTFIPAW